MEVWFNTAALVSFDEVRDFVGYMQTTVHLIEAVRTVCQSAYYYLQADLAKGLFVQQSLAILSIVSRVYYFLDKVKAEVPRERTKALLKLHDLEERAKIVAEFGIDTEVVQGTRGPDDILDTANMKEGKRLFTNNAPKHYQTAKKLKPNSVSTPTGKPKGDEMDDIFGF